jgi:hypothetical protein
MDYLPGQLSRQLQSRSASHPTRSHHDQTGYDALPSKNSVFIGG